jgi:hypothetical protein
MKTKPNENTQERRAHKAFVSSAGHTFDGHELYPFTPQRESVAEQMGMVWPWFTDADKIVFEVEAPDEKTGKATKFPVTHYRGSFKDSVIALWLCAQGESRVDRAERKPDEAMSEAWAWAKKIGLHKNSPKAGEALLVWIAMTNEVAESQAVPVPKHSASDTGDEPSDL